MKKSAKFTIMFGPPPEEDRRKYGSVYFADPSTVERTRNIHTFNEPHSPGAHGEGYGIKSISPWTSPEEVWRRHRGRRGLETNEEDE